MLAPDIPADTKSTNFLKLGNINGTDRRCHQALRYYSADLMRDISNFVQAFNRTLHQQSKEVVGSEDM